MNEKDKKILKSNEKWFGFYVHFPKISTWVLGALIFVWSIIDPAVFAWKDYYADEVYFGVMGWDTFFGAMAMWWLIGAVYCLMHYVTWKLIFSYQIVQVYYLKQMASGSPVAETSDAAQSTAKKDDYDDKMEAFKKVKELFDLGLITQKEYEAKKQQLLAD